jgi:hypothetical protein
MFGTMIAMLAFAFPANAAPYTTEPTTSVSNGAPTAGSSITFCGQGFAPGETVSVTLDNATTNASVTAGASGAFCTTIVLGATLTGNHPITARGLTSGRTSSAEVNVRGVSASAATTTSGGLAFTGAAVIGLGALGGLLLVGGAIMVIAGWRRKG